MFKTVVLQNLKRKYAAPLYLSVQLALLHMHKLQSKKWQLLGKLVIKACRKLMSPVILKSNVH